MRNSIVFLIVVLFTMVAIKSDVLAQNSGKTNKSKSADLSFEDLLVQGKYHFADEAVVTVEDDKILDSLLGVRKDFKDRIKTSASRY